MLVVYHYMINYGKVSIIKELLRFKQLLQFLYIDIRSAVKEILNLLRMQGVVGMMVVNSDGKFKIFRY